jgi:hypothetical protein
MGGAYGRSPDRFAFDGFPALTTLSDGIQRERIASVSDPAFLLDDGKRCSLEMPDLRTPADFHSLV